MPSQDLALLESQLAPLRPAIADVLAGGVEVARFMRTILISCERNPKLLLVRRQSLLNGAISAAVLKLEVDGVTGQSFLIPFKDQAQLVIGYRGFNTMGARSGFTITGNTVREGDDFDYRLGTAPKLDHVPKRGDGRITHAWAVATSKTLEPIVSVLSIDEILELKKRSPGAKKDESPWNDPKVGFPAMAEKSAKRRLSRSMPLNLFQVGAALDEAFEERGKLAYIDPDRGLQIEGGHADQLAPGDPAPTPGMTELLTPTQPSLQDRARAAARHGGVQFQTFWNELSKPEQAALRSIGEELRNLINEAAA